MLFWRAMCLVLIEQVVMAPMFLTDSSDTSVIRGRYETGVHTINNTNPYQGVTITEGHGKYPVTFEPLQNVQTSRSTYKITSFIYFTPYLEYFQQFERYLEAFKMSIRAFEMIQYYKIFENKLLLQPATKRGKHVGTILLAMYSPYFTSYELNRYKQ